MTSSEESQPSRQASQFEGKPQPFGVGETGRNRGRAINHRAAVPAI